MVNSNIENIVPISDSRYPKLLKVLGKDAPKQLYYKGNWEEGIFENCLAVVGSRRMTSYGRQITEKLVSEIASVGITIVSGFMYGIDAVSHKAAIDVGGRTIAVMPCGIDLIHPDYQKDLYQEILENKGLVISEYEGNFLPTLWTYPRRNRLVAGLSKAVMVVEAGEKSGSLITANFAKKYKRKVFAVPGPLTSSLSKGICQLIKEGADVVTGASDVLDFFGKRLTIKATETRVSVNSLIEQKIIQKLQQESMEIDALSRTLGISAAEIGTVVSLMQIKGLVFNENGKYYIKN
ncbi:MAG: DNA-protecting protein DprA [Candidatus Nealsonbacteria bacterium CG08_land_8_20_14_0_20_36_22]|uniref:DNA-protecting protein DprA n=2 Tax=Candidatus Nealsoniibacteriota TaxID=1817911 RepID=A0A2H0YRK4_9BACT|nr:MAG: DNA-protecting protein DprA [Candidatus Nealsonbacteria bacterium CG08_land_8_20_14_0_20_36_22]